MALEKQRMYRKNIDGTKDLIYRETSSDLVKHGDIDLNTKINNIDSSLADIVQYNLSSFCDDVTKSDSFNKFMSSLGNEKKILLIPCGKTLILNKYFYIPSNTTIKGDITFTGDVTVNTLWNESLMANVEKSTNITLNECKISYFLKNTGKNLFRFEDIDGLTIEKCSFFIKGNGTQNLNSIIDLWKGCRNVTIRDNKFISDNPTSSAGGCIWVHSSMVNGDVTYIDTTNVLIENNTFESNCGDEMVAVFSSGGNCYNVTVKNNTFIRKQSLKNIVLTAIPQTDITSIKVENIRFLNNTITIESTSTNNNECIRVGEVGRTVPIKDIVIENNNITGILKDTIVISVLGGSNETIIKKNTITNTGDKGTSYGIKCDTGINTVDDNKISNINTSITKSAKTISSNNYLDGVLIDYPLIRQFSYSKNGYQILQNGLKEFWMECYIDVNSGGTKQFTSPTTFSEIINQQVTIVNNPTLSNPSPVAIMAGGYDKFTLKNYNAEYVSVHVRILCK